MDVARHRGVGQAPRGVPVADEVEADDGRVLIVVVERAVVHQMQVPLRTTRLRTATDQSRRAGNVKCVGTELKRIRQTDFEREREGVVLEDQVLLERRLVVVLEQEARVVVLGGPVLVGIVGRRQRVGRCRVAHPAAVRRIRKSVVNWLADG